MFVFLSKFLPLFVYPLGLSIAILLLALILNGKPRLQQVLIILAIGVLWFGANRWTALSLVRSLEWRYLPAENIPSAEAIVILGGGTEPQQYPRPAVEVNSAGDRVLYGASLYKQGKAPYILVSGGVIGYLGVREQTPAEDMASLLHMLDIPADVIWLQSQSRNTYEDALYSRPILEENNIRRIILVTSALHMPRSVALFQKQGFEVIPAPADFIVTQADWDRLFKPSIESLLIGLVPDAGSLSNTTTALKEYFGMLVYGWRGWL